MATIAVDMEMLADTLLPGNTFKLQWPVERSENGHDRFVFRSTVGPTTLVVTVDTQGHYTAKAHHPGQPSRFVAAGELGEAGCAVTPIGQWRCPRPAVSTQRSL